VIMNLVEHDDAVDGRGSDAREQEAKNNNSHKRIQDGKCPAALWVVYKGEWGRRSTQAFSATSSW
jgi:hypothetical protein